MKSFIVSLSNRSFEIFREIIEEARQYIEIASFLFYDEMLSDLLIEKIKQTNVKVEILTTPPEAAESEELKKHAVDIHRKMRSFGINVITCDWEVGQPELTIATRAGGRMPRWFAMHSKFMVTDKCALITSADILEDFHKRDDWNTHILYRDPERIKQLHQKFNKLKNIVSNLPSHIGSEYIDTTVPLRKLIRGYPTKLVCNIPHQAGFYLLPHEAYGRQIIKKAISNAEEFVYLMFETIYDDDISRSAIKKLISDPKIDFKIITSPLAAYVQNKMKTKATFVELVSHGARIRSLRNLRAKMLITDKVLIGGSFDLVKMGLGTIRSIKKGLKALVASTEIMDINDSSECIEEAKTEFLRIFYDQSAEEYGLWFSKEAEDILRSAGAEIIAKDAKEFLGYLIFNGKRKVSERIKIISLIAVEIAKLKNWRKVYVKLEDIQKAEQILLLHEKGELSEESIRKILGILNAKSFLSRIKCICQQITRRSPC